MLDSHVKPSLTPSAVIHVCREVPAAIEEIPALLQGEPVKASSGYGSNVHSSSPVSGKVVHAIVVGGGFSTDDFDEIKTAVDKVKLMPYFRGDVNRAFQGKAPKGLPDPSDLIKRLKPELERCKDDTIWENGVYMW